MKPLLDKDRVKAALVHFHLLTCTQKDVNKGRFLHTHPCHSSLCHMVSLGDPSGCGRWHWNVPAMSPEGTTLEFTGTRGVEARSSQRSLGEKEKPHVNQKSSWTVGSQVRVGP